MEHVVNRRSEEVPWSWVVLPLLAAFVEVVVAMVLIARDGCRGRQGWKRFAGRSMHSWPRRQQQEQRQQQRR